MKPFFLVLFQFVISSLFAQQITYSDPVKDDTKDMDFDVIGKMSNSDILIFKNSRKNYAVSIYDNAMKLKENVVLDFFPDRTYNVEFIAYPDFFYMVYQYQKKGIAYCYYVKLDAAAKKIGDPVELDTTQVGSFGDNNIYSTISSEDKQKIMVLKVHKKNDRFNFVTLLFDKDMKLMSRARMALPYSDRKDGFSDFLLDNEGTFVFTQSTRSGSGDYVSDLDLISKTATTDTFTIRNLPLKEMFIDEVKLKIDNVNKRYIVNSFFYPKKRANIQGIYYNIWDKQGDSSYSNAFVTLDDTIRTNVKSEGSIKYAFNDFYIRNIVVKKDGGYLLIAEDYAMQSRAGASPWTRWNNFYGYPYMGAYNYYMYRPSYYNYYRPYYGNSYYGNQTKYYYNNIMVLSINNTGVPQWSNVVYKDQYADDTDNYYMSFLSFIAGGEVHFLFNSKEKRNQMLTDNSITPDGKLIRKPIFKNLDRGFDFMPKFGKQVSATQVVIPCTYRSLISFAKIEF